MEQNFLKSFDKNPSAAIFLSGSGTNAEILLKETAGEPDAVWHPAVLITDRPETSRARLLAEKYGLPLIGLDIRAFYRAEGLDCVTISTPEGMAVREKWTDRLRECLAPYAPDFGILAGFTTLCNITRDFPCLNVHPGDLTVRENGRRIYAGLHLGPTETAILRGERTIRSSVILAEGISTGASEMDEGPVLGLSEPLELDLHGMTAAEFRRIFEARAALPPAERKKDALARIAGENIDRLKAAGDWKLFPRVIRDFAQGFFSLKGNVLFYRGEPVSTVLYPSGRAPEPLPCVPEPSRV